MFPFVGLDSKAIDGDDFAESRHAITTGLCVFTLSSMMRRHSKHCNCCGGELYGRIHARLTGRLFLCTTTTTTGNATETKNGCSTLEKEYMCERLTRFPRGILEPKHRNYFYEKQPHKRHIERRLGWALLMNYSNSINRFFGSLKSGIKSLQWTIYYHRYYFIVLHFTLECSFSSSHCKYFPKLILLKTNIYYYLMKNKKKMFIYLFGSLHLNIVTLLWFWKLCH